MIPARTLNSGFEIPLGGLGTYGMDGAAGAAAMAQLSDAEMTALGALDLGEDAAVDSDARVEF